MNQFLNNLPTQPETPPMPVLFLGHGSPMNAIKENAFVQGFRQTTLSIPIPKAILCVSAHWETDGTKITAMEMPPTIHDFSGFPEDLYKVQYPAPGSPALAEETSKIKHHGAIGLDYGWGLDHGAWSVIRHLYPKANIPVLQLSLDYKKNAAEHFSLAQELIFLRKKGVLIIGSGNIVHNLSLVAWEKLDTGPFAFPWATEAIEKIKHHITGNQLKELIQYSNLGTAGKLAIPTPEHYLPLLYTLALKQDSENINFFNDQPVAGSIYMTSVRIG